MVLLYDAVCVVCFGCVCVCALFIQMRSPVLFVMYCMMLCVLFFCSLLVYDCVRACAFNTHLCRSRLIARFGECCLCLWLVVCVCCPCGLHTHVCVFVCHVLCDAVKVNCLFAGVCVCLCVLYTWVCCACHVLCGVVKCVVDDCFSVYFVRVFVCGCVRLILDRHVCVLCLRCVV